MVVIEMYQKLRPEAQKQLLFFFREAIRINVPKIDNVLNNLIRTLNDSKYLSCLLKPLVLLLFSFLSFYGSFFSLFVNQLSNGTVVHVLACNCSVFCWNCLLLQKCFAECCVWKEGQNF